MAIRFHLKPCALTALLDSSHADGRNDAPAAALGVKAAELLEQAKLLRTISDLEDEIALQMRSIGELIYATHRGTPSDSEELQRILEYVDDLRDELEGHEQQLKLLNGVIPCPVCGGDVRADDVYCQQCGQPLPVPAPKQS